ncbi:hypothetical protein [[Scytonema hofmanni] UTEX B 1581]|uniref:hypothetical protein n=1 Tax=[Scytonema hofmanni] UTEX B 1581 TaxID=379535 RepID=UPI0004B7574F|nr:hypothetical protein [[Scytonema hofmanni] UTEX B 1581]
MFTWLNVCEVGTEASGRDDLMKRSHSLREATKLYLDEFPLSETAPQSLNFINQYLR